MTAWLRRNVALIVPTIIVGALAACGLPERVMASAVVVCVIGGGAAILLGLDDAGHMESEGGEEPPEKGESER